MTTLLTTFNFYRNIKATSGVINLHWKDQPERGGLPIVSTPTVTVPANSCLSPSSQLL